MQPKKTSKKLQNRISAEIVVDWRDRDVFRNPVALQVENGRLLARVSIVGDDGTLSKPRLHVLIAERHLPKPGPDFDVVEALNGNKLDCRASNLEWRRRDDTDYKRATNN